MTTESAVSPKPVRKDDYVDSDDEESTASEAEDQSTSDDADEESEGFFDEGGNVVNDVHMALHARQQQRDHLSRSDTSSSFPSSSASSSLKKQPSLKQKMRHAMKYVM